MSNIKIYLNDGSVDGWEAKDYTHYKIKKEMFFVFKDTKAIGMYNLSQIKKVIVK